MTLQERQEIRQLLRRRAAQQKWIPKPAKRYGLRVRSLECVAPPRVESANDKGECSVCRGPQPNGWHTHACE